MGGWSVFIFQAQHGLGKHLNTIDRGDFVKFQHAGFWQSIISATISLTFLKISIAVNLLRLGSRRWYRWSLITIIGKLYIVGSAVDQISAPDTRLIGVMMQVTNICFSISGIFTFTLYCRPMAGYWDKSLNPNCASIKVLVRGGLSNTGKCSMDVHRLSKRGILTSV